MNRRCMLIILLLCVLKTSGQKDDATDDDYYDDDDDITSEKAEVSPSNLPPSIPLDEGASEQINEATTLPTTPTVLLTVPTTTTTAPPTTATPTLEVGEAVETTTSKTRPECPEGCHCVKDEVECSHRNLLQIPKYLPLNTTSLNLSHNNLTTLNVSDLIEYSQLEQLILNDNKIETIIDTEAFQKLPNLHHIDLTRNALKPLQGFEFSRAKALTRLNLTGNKNVVAPNVAFVQTFKLRWLHLSNCNITDFSDNTFQNLSTLLALYLDDNPLNESMNVNALKYLVNLRTFNIPKIDRKIAGKICEQLESLDIMHLTSETFDLSCFELSSGSTFDDSTIRIGQTTLSFLENDSDDLYKKPTNPPPPPPPEPTVLAITETTVGAPQKGSKNIGPKVSSQKMSQISQNETQVESVGSQLSGSEQPKDVVQEATVDVPIEMIYLILIVVIAVTLVCLTIGVICRLDCCGIKTKCCRRTHNRAETEDRVRPHEEIPLNKV